MLTLLWPFSRQATTCAGEDRLWKSELEQRGRVGDLSLQAGKDTPEPSCHIAVEPSGGLEIGSRFPLDRNLHVSQTESDVSRTAKGGVGVAILSESFAEDVFAREVAQA